MLESDWSASPCALPSQVLGTGTLVLSPCVPLPGAGYSLVEAALQSKEPQEVMSPAYLMVQRTGLGSLVLWCEFPTETWLVGHLLCHWVPAVPDVGACWKWRCLSWKPWADISCPAALHVTGPHAICVLPRPW